VIQSWDVDEWVVLDMAPMERRRAENWVRVLQRVEPDDIFVIVRS